MPVRDPTGEARAAGSLTLGAAARRRRPRGRGATDEEPGEVVIYWRPDCVFCLDLLLRLRFTRLRYRKVDIRHDPDARAFVRSVADGNETVPTVVVAGRALVNPSKRQLIQAVQTLAPQALSPAR